MNIGQTIARALSILLIIGSLIILFTWGYSNDIAKINKLKEEVRLAYNKARYFTVIEDVYLLDSLYQVREDALTLNRTNAAQILDWSILGNDGKVDMTDLYSTFAEKSDSLKSIVKLIEKDTLGFENLIFSGNSEIASIASNQKGVKAYKQMVSFEKGDEIDSHLETIKSDFKYAIEKDPHNSIAIYNYELLSRQIGFSDKALRAARDLVAATRYAEALQLLESASKKDPRIQLHHKEYIKRLTDIVTIDQQQQ